MADKNKQQNINIKNRKASFEFEFIDEYEAGITLTGTEIKSIRSGKASLQESYCYINKGELWIKGMHISPYENGGYANHEPTRLRKLLLHKRELLKIDKKLNEKGLTVVPYRLYINNRGLAKLKIAVAKGKKLHDKRESMKEKDAKRQMDRAL